MDMRNHWRACFDNRYLGAWDLPPDTLVPLVIERVERGVVKGHGGKEDKKALIFFRGKKKALAANKTNCGLIAGMYGNDVRRWAGKAIDVYATETAFGSQMVPCVRVSPQPPPTPLKARRRDGAETETPDIDANNEPPETADEEAAQ